MANVKRDDTEDTDVSRRGVLGVLVGAGTALAFGCGTSSSASDGGADAGGTGGTGGAEAGACAVTPEGEIGPYFADDSDTRFNRSNILSNLDGTDTQTGVGLTLAVTIVDANAACAPYASAQVDIWHCNAAGIYSDQAAENTLSVTWLRGYQLTDANGLVTFVTIIPGWYSGRTTHIHLRVRSSYSQASSTTDGTNTTQLFFDQTLINALSTNVAPYNAEGTNPTTNASDHVYSGETNGANLLALSGSNASGYTASLTIVLPITGSGTDGGGPGGGPPPGGP